MDIDSLLAYAQQDIQSSQELTDLEQIRVKFLGKKGLLTEQLKQLGTLPAAERPIAGQRINEVKQQVQDGRRVPASVGCLLVIGHWSPS